MLLQCVDAIRACTKKFFLGHLRAHTNLPGALSLGNAKADAATRNAFFFKLQEAQEAHKLHDLKSRALQLQFGLTRDQSCQIVKQCTNCVKLLPVPHLGVNPRGLIPNALWQMDVTHVPEFGQLKFLHVCVDTFSGFVLASLHTGEAVNNVIAHLLYCFSIIGLPSCIKTDNAPAYCSHSLKNFCSKLQITLKNGHIL